MNGKYVTAVVKFTSIELLVNITCKIYNQSLYTALRKREGFGGEKAATGAASLPVPNNFNISLNLRKLSRLRLSTVPYAAPAPCVVVQRRKRWSLRQERNLPSETIPLRFYAD